MNKIVIRVFLPTTQQYFDVRLPCAMNSLIAGNLTAKALYPLSGNTYLPSKKSVFAWKETGQLLSFDKSLEEEGVINGSCLMII